MEGDVEQQIAGTEATDIQWNIIIHLIDSQLHVERFHLAASYQHFYICIFFTLLNGQ